MADIDMNRAVGLGGGEPPDARRPGGEPPGGEPPDARRPDARRNELFRDPVVARTLLDGIRARAFNLQLDRAEQPLRLMEVCGTHTMAIAKSGLRSLLPAGIRLLSGPGCPVCVTANSDIDRIIALTRTDALVTTFGDMLRVPGSSTSLSEQRARGAHVDVVYSPLDALQIAQQNSERQVVFIAVGFETTAPVIAATILRAQALGLKNFSVLSALKQVPPALVALLNDDELNLDGLILPGHVSTILGLSPYAFIADEYRMPAVVTGFEPLDILAGVAMLLDQVAARRAGQPLTIGNAYTRSVQEAGNTQARDLMDRVFTATDANWRGLGPISSSGFSLRDEYGFFDAERRFELDVEETVEVRGCRCGDVLRGVIDPVDCPLFGRGCTPANPLGPCMVSSEGSCAAWYRYGLVA